MTKARSPLNYENFRMVLVGQFVSLIGSSAHTVAISFFLKEATQSGSFVGAGLFFCGIAALLTLPLSGVIADRINRKSIVIRCDTVGACATLALACVFHWGSGNQGALLPVLAVLCSLVISVSSSFFRPAFGAMLPDLVPQAMLAPANALYKAGARCGDLLGNLVGGLAYGLVGPGALFLANSLSYVLAVQCVSRAEPSELFVPQPRTMKSGVGILGLLTEFYHGAGALCSLPGGRLFLSMALVINFFATPILVLMPFHASGVLRADAPMYGFLMAMLSLGVLMGYTMAAKVPMPKFMKTRIVLYVVTFMCGCFLLFSQIRIFSVACVLLVAAGIANGYWSIFFETALQKSIARSELGRVYAFYGLLSGGMIPLASLVGGIALDALGGDTRILFSVCSLMMTAYPIFLSTRKEFFSFFESLERELN
ncbi:MFS transporter [Cupriavidus alkaliphilus]|uniref:MFS transporter n=1 Tax=Cupriavidus alkaliphilus TaxID=942866 RepID=UPI000DC4751F|nr:MFS transporter [Cupriavidus alkaliphilus]RAS12193.1 transmembrane secretion effector [Cupriavidus alkaliphilus]